MAQVKNDYPVWKITEVIKYLYVGYLTNLVKDIDKQYESEVLLFGKDEAKRKTPEDCVKQANFEVKRDIIPYISSWTTDEILAVARVCKVEGHIKKILEKDI